MLDVDLLKGTLWRRGSYFCPFVPHVPSTSSKRVFRIYYINVRTVTQTKLRLVGTLTCKR